MSNDDFDKKMDKAVSDYEKVVDSLAPKLGTAVEKVGRGLNRLYIGCAMIFGNLFFAAFCLWGAYSAVISWKLQTSGEITNGTVTRLEESKTREGYCCVYSPVVEFQVDGQTYSFENDSASSSPDYQIGSEVKVRYDPADPNTAQINTFSNRWLFPIIIIPAMIIGSLILSFYMIRAWRRDEDLISEQFV
jgi:hypothetical protein